MKKHMFVYLLLMTFFAVDPSSGQPMRDLNFIWSVTGIENEPVTMVLNQNGSDIYGQVKYEPDSGQAWNGLVVGSVQEDSIDLMMAILKNKEQSAFRMKGAYDAASGMIKGAILHVSSGKISSQSDFEAMPISPDTSSYTPAQDSPRSEDHASNSASNQQMNGTMQKTRGSLQPESQKESRYHDVREYADSILTGVGDISQIPIGMSGL